MSAALFACKGPDTKAPGGCESGYVLTQGNVCVLQNIVDYNQCVENAAARESINVGLTKEILGRLQLQWVGPDVGPTPDARAKAAKFIELNPGSCRELEGRVGLLSGRQQGPGGRHRAADLRQVGHADADRAGLRFDRCGDPGTGGRRQPLPRPSAGDPESDALPGPPGECRPPAGPVRAWRCSFRRAQSADDQRAGRAGTAGRSARL